MWGWGGEKACRGWGMIKYAGEKGDKLACDGGESSWDMGDTFA